MIIPVPSQNTYGGYYHLRNPQRELTPPMDATLVHVQVHQRKTTDDGPNLAQLLESIKIQAS